MISLMTVLSLIWMYKWWIAGVSFLAYIIFFAPGQLNWPRGRMLRWQMGSMTIVFQKGIFALGKSDYEMLPRSQPAP